MLSFRDAAQATKAAPAGQQKAATPGQQKKGAAAVAAAAASKPPAPKAAKKGAGVVPKKAPVTVRALVDSSSEDEEDVPLQQRVDALSAQRRKQALATKRRWGFLQCQPLLCPAFHWRAGLTMHAKHLLVPCGSRAALAVCEVVCLHVNNGL